MPDKELVQDYGKINAWELCTYDMYRHIQMDPYDVDYFLHLLFSHTSESIKYRGMDAEEMVCISDWRGLS